MFIGVDPAIGWSRVRWWVIAFVVMTLVMVAMRPEQFGVMVSQFAKSLVPWFSAWLGIQTFFHPLYLSSKGEELPAEDQVAVVANFWANTIERVAYFLAFALVVHGCHIFWGSVI